MFEKILICRYVFLRVSQKCVWVGGKRFAKNVYGQWRLMHVFVGIVVGFRI